MSVRISTIWFVIVVLLFMSWMGCSTAPVVGDCDGGPCPDKATSTQVCKDVENGYNKQNINPNDRACSEDCQCNNQEHTGICKDKKCVSKPRVDCSVQGEVDLCVLDVKEGECALGKRICKEKGLDTNKWGDCKPTPPTKEDTNERCKDDADNDCDGLTDKDDPDCKKFCQPGATRACYTGAQDTRKQGDCRDGVEQCSDEGEWSGECKNEVLPKEETCNQKDDDCDGQVDEELDNCKSAEKCEKGQTKVCYSSNKGCIRQSSGKFACNSPCKVGVRNCTDKGVFDEVCTGEKIPDDKEVCDGIDNNCDGQVDEDFRIGKGALGQACSAGQGACKTAGKYVCKKDGFGTECDAAPKDSAKKDETCNGKDDDCDGTIDNIKDRPCYDPKAKGCEQNSKGVWTCKGECKTGLQRCTNGAWEACVLKKPTTPGQEDCNKKDDDCDGEIDEGVCGDCKIGETAPCYPANTIGCSYSTTLKQWDCKGVGKGTCQVGTKTCQKNLTWGPCSGAITPKTETCNGIDDDCNGKIDNEPGRTTILAKPCYSGSPNTQGKGICKGGAQSCINGQYQGPCVNEVTPKQFEVCNGFDDDCDGKVDNIKGKTELITQSCNSGPCGGKGTQTCRGGKWSYCESLEQVCYNPLSSQDKGCVKQSNGSYLCNSPCKTGIQKCQGTSWGACVGQVRPTGVEICNGKDDDCDGLVDNNVKSQAPTCTRNVGVCKGALKSICVRGVWSNCTTQDYKNYNSTYEVTETKCDGLDNDCDGLVDNISGQSAALSRSCSSCGGGGVQLCNQGSWSTCVKLCYNSSGSGCVKQSNGSYLCKGICKAGQQTCSGSNWSSCSGENGPKTEVCNLQDDDCNGKIDDGLKNCVYTFSGKRNTYSSGGPNPPPTRYPQDGDKNTAVIVEMRYMTIDPNGNLYVVDSHRIRKIDQKGNVTTVLGSGINPLPTYNNNYTSSPLQNGIANVATIGRVRGVVVDHKGNVFFTEEWHNCVRKYDVAKKTVSTFAGTCKAGNQAGGYKDGSASQALFKAPSAILIDFVGNVFVSDAGNRRIRRINANGVVSTFVGGGRNRTGAPFDVSLDQITYMAWGSNGSIYAFDYNGYELTLIDSRGYVTRTPYRIPPGVGSGTKSHAVDANGLVYITGGVRIYQVGTSGGTLFAGPPYNGSSGGGYKDGPALQALFGGNSMSPSGDGIRGLVFDSQGNMYVADEGNGLIRKIVLNIEPCSAPGLTRPCYAGPTGAQGNGACKAGKQTCQNGIWSVCVGQVLPGRESCSGKDEDCDGTLDNVPGLKKSCSVPGQSGPCATGTYACVQGKLDMVCQTGQPVQEICNNFDDDCDGKIDNIKGQTQALSRACFSGTPTQLKNAPCKAGTQLCSGGAWFSCTGDVAPSTEVCDGKDNDCNGVIDDNTVKGGQACTVSGKKGPCAEGKYKCQGGKLLCPDTYIPTKEVCDGKDNDCDGVIDNNPVDTQIGSNCTNTTLAPSCQAGKFACSNGKIICQSNVAITPEVCDGKDNDCDGVIDNQPDKVGQTCTVSNTKGPCAKGLYQCNSGTLSCISQHKSSAEICNGQDDDCDGSVDEGLNCGALMVSTISTVTLFAVSVVGDANGNLYIASSTQINKIDPVGTVTLFAGDKTSGFSDGVGASARFNCITDIAIDRGGYLYVTDSCNYRVRKITPLGSVTTLAGSGVKGFKDGPAKTAQFDKMESVAVDGAGNVFIADTSNYRIRRIDQNGLVSTVLGTGKSGHVDGHASFAQVSYVRDMAVDRKGSLYFLDSLRVRKMDAGGNVTTLAGSGKFGLKNGPGKSAEFKSLYALAVDHRGFLYVAGSSYCVRQIDLANKVTTYAGTCVSGMQDGVATTAKFSRIYGLATNGMGDLIVSDSGNRKIRRVGRRQSCSTNNTTRSCYMGPLEVKGLGACKAGTQTCTNGVWGRCVGQVLPSGEDCNGKDDDCDGSIDNNVLPGPFCSNQKGACFGSSQQVCSGGTWKKSCTSDDYKVRAPQYNGTEVCNRVDSNCNGQVDEGITACLTTLQSGQRSVYFRYPRSIVVDSKGNLFVLDTGNYKIIKFDTTGKATTFAGSSSGYKDGKGTDAKFRTPYGIVIDRFDNLYVADLGSHNIRKIDPQGNVTTFAGSTKGFRDDIASKAMFDQPTGLVLDGKGNLFVLERGNHRVRKIDKAGNVTTYAGRSSGTQDGPRLTAQFYYPNDITMDASGNFYIVESSRHRIRKIDTTGNVTTFAGNGYSGFKNGPRTSAQFNRPEGVTVDQQGNVYIADTNNHRIRKIDTSGNVTTIAGSGTEGIKDGVPLQGEFKGPGRVYVSPSGFLYISDTNNNRIRIIKLK